MTRRPLWPTIAWGTILTTALCSGCGYSRTTLPYPLAHTAHKPADKRFAAAQSAEREGQLQQAEHTYRELVAEQPRMAQFHHRLGVVLVREGQLEEGIVELKAAKALDPRNSTLLNDLGYACMLQGDFPEAVAVTRQALALNPDDSRARHNLTMALGLSGETQEALALFRQGQPKVPSHTAQAEVRNSPSDQTTIAAAGPANAAAAQTPTSVIPQQDEQLAPWDSDDLQLVSGRQSSDFHDLLADEPPLEAGLVELLQELESAPPADERAAVQYFEWYPLTPHETVRPR